LFILANFIEIPADSTDNSEDGHNFIATTEQLLLGNNTTDDAITEAVLLPSNNTTHASDDTSIALSAHEVF
jgi:hypothetical protein